MVGHFTNNHKHKRVIIQKLTPCLFFVLVNWFPLSFFLFLPSRASDTCCAAQDYRAKTDYCRQVIALAEPVHPTYFLPLANYHEALSQVQMHSGMSAPNVYSISVAKSLVSLHTKDK